MARRSSGLRRGERPSISEYFQQYPDVAGELAYIIDALLWLEEMGAADSISDSTKTRLPERLGDFGLVHLADEAPLTSAGGFIGTLRNLAPERTHGDGEARAVFILGRDASRVDEVPAAVR